MHTFRFNRMRDMDRVDIGLVIFFAFVFLMVLGGFGLNIYRSAV